jgi:selenide,water dikinase
MIPFDHPWIEAEVAPMEDAALLRPEVGPPLAFSVDFITPIVDDPEAFGAIAAANSMSDVYAMGGEPQIALAVCGYPEGKISLEVLQRILRGGRDKAAEAGCAIAGGHTMIDPELKYGLCVIGSVDPERVLSQTDAQAGDRLVLTKPIGTGIASQGIKKGELSDSEVAEVIEVMSTLNRAGKQAALASGAHAATDVTGFGLLGHLHNMVLGAGRGARVSTSAVPLFPFTRPLARAGRIPGGTRKNFRYVEPHVLWDDAIDETDRLILCDAQTSGGLLLCVPPERESTALRELERLGSPAAAVIGEVVESPPGRVEVTS